MSKIPIIDVTGASVGDFEFDDALMVLDKGDQAVHDVVVAYLAGLRAGTASTLGKGQVAGSNRKPWRQKGLGRARAGYRQSPIWRGGGVVFGPHPHSYAKDVPRKVARLAFRRVVSDKVAGKAFRVLNELALGAPKTKELAAIMKSLGLKSAVLLLLDKPEQNITRAARNLSGVQLVLARNVNTYQLLKYPAIVANRGAMEVLVNRLAVAAGKNR